MTIQNKKQLKTLGKKAITNVLLVVVFFALINIVRPVIVLATEPTAQDIADAAKAKAAAAEAEKARQEAENKVNDTKKQLKKLEKKKKKTEKIKATYTQEANIIQGSISNLVGNINTIQKKVKRTEGELEKIQNDIKKYEEEIKINKQSLTKIIRKINQQRLELQLSVLDTNKGIDDYMYNRGSLNDLQKKVLVKLDDLKEKKRELDKVKQEKAETRNKLDSQKSGLEHEKVKKSWLLNQKNEKISQHEEEIKGIQRKINKLNSTLSSFLGKSFDTNDIVEAIKFASRKTGVRKEFLMAMLDKETDLGRFTGGCTYKNTRVRDNDKKIFKQICEELDYNYKKRKISCSLSYGYGGAMGVAQFMPSTWMGYKSRISRYTGHKPANPWSLTDGVMGMAIKLKDAGAGSKGGEYKAAAMYYCGGNWKRAVCKNYANTVKSWAKGGYKEYF